MSTRIGNVSRSSAVLWMCALGAPFAVHAGTEGAPEQHVVYDREQGELSVGTKAPSRERMMNAIRSASPTGLTAVLEYGERVECLECIPLLETKLLAADDARVREISAWWLRKRPFGYGRVAVRMREVVIDDADATRRSRAAEALGEFMDVKGLPALTQAAMVDHEPQVRLAAVRALGRLNSRSGHTTIAAAMGDDDAQVRHAALEQVTRVNFWKDADAVIALLGDGDAQVRIRAAQVTGELRMAGAVDSLTTVLRNDSVAAVRQAAAWSLGRIGGGAAQSALRAAEEGERDDRVADALRVALAMNR
jgi:HEAT repeat protein